MITQFYGERFVPVYEAAFLLVGAFAIGFLFGMAIR